MTVIIGIDPHKASHTAVAIGCDERQVAEIKVRATCQQTTRLLAWAEPVLSENSNLASCRQLVLMDKSAQPVAPTNLSSRAPEMPVPTVSG